ncbi:MAG: hypothetical protein OXH68_18595 [Gammaproteobacteria bacterium]|nr:hypothetical protein [Gammaproteobacteria bacterium]
MKIIDSASNGITLSVDQEELRAIKCSLGESIEVIEPCAFKARMGVAADEVRRLTKALTAVYRSRGRRKEILVSNQELATIRNGLMASLDIDDWEFHPRMGFTKAQVRSVLAEVSGLVPG